MAGDRGDRGGLPVGVVAAVTFVAGVLFLYFLFRSGTAGGAAPPLDAEFDTPAFEERVAASLDPVTVRPAGALRVRVGQVVWRDAAGRAFLEIPTAAFAVEFGGPGGGVVLRDGVVTRPDVRLVRSPAGQWNYEPRLAPLLGRDGRGDYDRGGTSGLALVDFTIRGGTVTVDLPESSFAARSIDLQLASAEISGPGVSAPVFRIGSATAALELPDTAGGFVTRQVALENALLRVDDGVVAFDIRRGRFGASTFADAAGIWDPALGGLGLDATVVAEDVRLADIPWLRAEVPTDAAGSFRLRISPRTGGRTELTVTALSLRAPGSSATGSLTAVFGPGGFSLESVDLRVDPLALSLVEAFAGPLPYTGELRGTLTGTGGDIRFDLTATVATSPTATPFDTELTGMISFTPQGIELGTVTATLDQLPLAALAAIAPGLPFGGPLSGTVTLDGLPSAEPIRLDVRLEAGGGIILVAGVLDLTGTVPAYDLSGTLAGVELRRVFEPAMPPAQVHAAFELEGRGTELATADARIRLNGTFTGWRAEPGDTVALVATVAAGRLDAQTARLELGPVSFTAIGEWDMVGEGGGAVRYALAVSALEPLAPYLPQDAGRPRFSRGSLSAEGSLSGTLDAPVVAGQVDAREFRFGEWAAERLEGEYSARFTGALPVLEADVSGTELRTPAGDFERLEVTADFTRPAFRLSVDATQMGGGVFQVEADGLIEDAGGREIQLRTAEVDLEDQRWRLPTPARIAWTAGDAVQVEDLRLEQTDGPGRLRLDGIVAPFDDADFAVDVTSMPIGDVLDVVGIDVGLTGDLTLDGRVRGPSDAPIVDLRIALADGSVRDVAVRSLDALVAYQGTTLSIEGVGTLSDSAAIELTGALPARLTLGLPPTLELIEGGAIEARLATDAFPLETLEPGIRSVRELEGFLTADVRISGTAGAPQLAGGASLVAGAVTVPLLDKRYTGIEGSAVLEGRTVRVTRLIARSGGTATVEGVITFAELTDPTFDLSARLEAFEPQGVDNADDAGATGTLRLTGSLGAPVLSGRVTLDDGTLSIAAFGGGGPGFTDRLVGVAESFDQIATGELDIPGADVAAVRVRDLRVTAGPDMWFATEEARAQLRGTLELETVGNDVTILGTLTGEQGTFSLRAGPIRRRFEVVSATIRFLGSPDPNPGLDITASRIVPTPEGGVINVQARVTGTLNDPHLSLGSAEGIAVAESELLSLVLFGRPTFTAGEVAAPWQEDFLPNIFAFAGIFDIGSEWLGQIDVLEELDQFQIQMRAGSGGFERSNLWVVLGKQIGDEVFASVESPLDESDLFVLAAEWRIDRQWTLEASWEPETYLGATGTGSIPVREITDIDRQYLIVIRRRWTY